MAPLSRCLSRAAAAAVRNRATASSPQTQHLALLDAFAGYVSSLFAHPGSGRPRLHHHYHYHQRRLFHTYFVTHLPSSSMHPDSSRQMLLGTHHKLPRAASLPHTPETNAVPATLGAGPVSVTGQLGQLGQMGPMNGLSGLSGVGTMSGNAAGLSRDLTVVRIPLRSAKHHFGVYNERGQRRYNEDTYQAGTIDMPAFAKRAPISLVRSAVANSRSTGEGITADSALGDPQIFYFGIFDGHGGDECSSFLRDELHDYIEAAARAFGLQSSLRKAKGSDVEAEPRAVQLQRDLLTAYRNTIGGYFRRFKPETFAEGTGLRPSVGSATAAKAAPAPVTIESVLTYAFLRADLDFVTAQARKPDPDDPRVADVPLNQDEVLGSPHQPPTGHEVTGSAGGGAVRFKGGSTASVALISTPTPAPFWHPAARASLMVAHVGDTRVLLCETATGQARPLTRDHHPSSPIEARRLTRLAESLVTDSFGEERISGLANSRAFGDMQSKRIGVSAEPELARVDLGPAQYSFLVLVSDGVSGTLSDQEIVDIVKEARTPEQASRDVVAYANEVSLDGDNVTCLVVRLGGWERRSEGGVGALGTKEIRDARLAEAQDPRRGRQ